MFVINCFTLLTQDTQTILEESLYPGRMTASGVSALTPKRHNWSHSSEKAG